MAVALMLHYVLHGAQASPHCIEAVSHSMLGVTSTLMLHMGFYSKIPCYPLHHWLTEAHVESTTEGSVILAGIYLKIGVLG